MITEIGFQQFDNQGDKIIQIKNERKDWMDRDG